MKNTLLLSEQLQIIKNIEKKLSISNTQDWYKFSILNLNKEYKKQISSTLVSCNLFNLLKICYPTFDWKEWLFDGNCESKIWERKLYRRILFQQVSHNLNVNIPSNWYNVTSHEVCRGNNTNASSILTNFYDGSLVKSLIDIYPEFKELSYIWRYTQVPNGYWKSIKNQKYYFENIGKEIAIKNISDWYKIGSYQLKQYKSLYLQQKYTSIFEMLKNIYPNFIWNQWKFNTVPKNCWKQKYNRRQYLIHISKNLNIKYQKDWYKINSSDIIKIDNFSFFQNFYHFSNYNFLLDLFPEVLWNMWEFNSGVPKGFWNSINNQRQSLNEVKKYLNIKSQKDWYLISWRKLIKFPTPYFKYNSTLEMLRSIYPEHVWNSWQFETVSKHCWKTKFNRRQRLIQTLKHLNLKQSNNLYKINSKYLNNSLNAKFFENFYKYSLCFMCIDLFPEIIWLPWKFLNIPSNYWENNLNVLYFLKYVENYYKFKNKEDWFFLTQKQLIGLGGSSLLKKFQNIPNILNFYFPNNNWKLIFNQKKNIVIKNNK